MIKFFSGRPNRNVMCHEVFHVIWFYLLVHANPKMPSFQKNKENKTSELQESLPQFFSILATEDCNQSQSAKAYSFDHCKEIKRSQLPSAYERYSMMNEYSLASGFPPVIAEENLNPSSPFYFSKIKPSAYDASRPLGAILFNSKDACQKDFLISELISFMYQAAIEGKKHPEVFYSTDNFGIALIKNISQKYGDEKMECIQYLNSKLHLLTEE